MHISTSRHTTYPSLSLLEALITRTLDDRKAEDVLTVDLVGKADFADRMILATGTSARHVASLADHVVQALHEAGVAHVPVEGLEAAEWVLVDAGDVIVHLFRPEFRARYNLEKMWSVQVPEPERTAPQPEMAL